jgi:hypothetical protein
MRRVIVLIAAMVLLSLVSTAAIAKECTIGIYGVVDQVTFTPDSSSPKLVRISGVSVVPVPVSTGLYKAPQRGYLYFRIPRGREVEALNDWNELKSIVGTGQVVGFTNYWMRNPDGRGANSFRSLEVPVHSDGETVTPRAYPHSHSKGIVKAGGQDDPAFDKIAAQLEEAWRNR